MKSHVHTARLYVTCRRLAHPSLRATITCMNTKSLPYALAVFCGGVSYALGVVQVKLTYADGFTWQESAFSQALFAFLLFGVCALGALAMRKRPVPMTVKHVVQLLALGMCGCTTTLLYSYALTMLPIPIAITLLFQYAWMGQIVQAVVQKTRVSRVQIIATVCIVIGTLFASGLIGGELAGFNALGCFAALGSAISCTAFMKFNATIGQDLPWWQRGTFVCLGGVLLTFWFCPGYFPSGVLFEGIAGHGLILGLTSMFLPVLLFGYGTPHIPVGIASILASSELPVGIIISYLALGEGSTGLQILGVVTVLAGIVISQLPALLPADRVDAAHQG